MSQNDRNIQNPSTKDEAAKLAAAPTVAKPGNDSTSPKRGGESKTPETTTAPKGGERKDGKSAANDIQGTTSKAWVDGKKS